VGHLSSLIWSFSQSDRGGSERNNHRSFGRKKRDGNQLTGADIFHLVLLYGARAKFEVLRKKNEVDTWVHNWFWVSSVVTRGKVFVMIDDRPTKNSEGKKWKSHF